MSVSLRQVLLYETAYWYRAVVHGQPARAHRAGFLARAGSHEHVRLVHLQWRDAVRVMGWAALPRVPRRGGTGEHARQGGAAQAARELNIFIVAD